MMMITMITSNLASPSPPTKVPSSSSSKGMGLESLGYRPTGHTHTHIPPQGDRDEDGGWRSLGRNYRSIGWPHSNPSRIRWGGGIPFSSSYRQVLEQPGSEDVCGHLGEDPSLLGVLFAARIVVVAAVGAVAAPYAGVAGVTWKIRGNSKTLGGRFFLKNRDGVMLGACIRH